jgi:copper(I)-binding protein
MKKLIMLVLISVSTLAANGIKIENPYVRATPPNLPNSAAFMTIENSSDKNIAIVNATSDVSKVVELHTHTMKDGVMTMLQIPKIDIPANGKTVLKPGGLHIMFIGLKKSLKVGDSVTFTIELSNGKTKTITAPIKKVMAGMKHHGLHNKH